MEMFLVIIIPLVWLIYALYKIVFGALVLINDANGQTDVTEESGVVLKRRRAKAAWTKIVIGAAMLFAGGAIIVLWIFIRWLL